jgi:transcriptional regulator with XRE-family HTH domain
MTPETLKQLRKDRGLTREELASQLGCSASAIVHWEGGAREIPSWVEEKMLKNIQLTFPLEQLHEMMNMARDLEMSFEDLLKESIQHVITTRRSKTGASTVSPEATPPTANIVHLPSPSELNKPRDIAAESQATGTGPKIRKDTSYGSSLRPRKPKE